MSDAAHLDAYAQALIRIAATGSVWAHQTVAAETADRAAAAWGERLPTGTPVIDQERTLEHAFRLHAAARIARAGEAQALAEWRAAYAEARVLAAGRDVAAWAAYDQAWAEASDAGRSTMIAAARAFGIAMERRSAAPAAP